MSNWKGEGLAKLQREERKGVVLFLEAEDAALYRLIEGAERHGQSDDDDDATASQGHGRGRRTAHSVIAFVTEVSVR